MEQQHDTIFKHALAHLRLYIINVHNSYMLLNGLTVYNKNAIPASFVWHKYMYYLSTLYYKVPYINII